MTNGYKDFLKTQHPEMYSDSVEESLPELTKESVAFFLSSLSSLSKEHEFEAFCRALIRASISPNLIIQTGPTGGGDSKVDSETYPVDQTLAETWPFTEAISSSGERWAFAMSLKQDWKSKIKSDVRKIRKTEDEMRRGYTKVFYFSNQNISDKKRAETEDTLRIETGFDIRIFDLNWLVEKTIESDTGRIAAIECLGMSANLINQRHNGAEDSARTTRLTAINKQLNDDIDTLSNKEKIELASEAAELIGQLEEPDDAIRGYLDRHYRLAKRYGDFVEITAAVYLYAYRLAAYCDDFDIELFYEKYVELEELVLKNKAKFAIENLITLWTILKARSFQTPFEKKCDQHAETLKLLEKELIESGDRESTALEVSMRMVPVRLMLGESQKDMLTHAIQLVKKSRKYLSIDCRIIIEMINIPNLFDESDLYDEAIEVVFERVQDDEGVSALAPSFFRRGVSLEQSAKYEKAIGMYTKAAISVRGKEDKSNLAKTLIRLAECYEKIGLFWFARNAYNLALNIGIDSYYGDGYLIEPTILACRKLKYSELHFGRLNIAIKLDNLEAILADLFSSKDYLLEEEEFFDQSLAMGILLVQPSEFRTIETLPNILHSVGYIQSALIMKYAFGHYDENALSELSCTRNEFDGLVKKCFSRFDEIHHFSNPCSFLCDGKCQIKSRLLGCEIVIETDRAWQCYEVATSILASIEGFFGTGLAHDLYATREKIDVTVFQNKDDSELFSLESTMTGYSLKVGNILGATNKEIREKWQGILPEIIGKTTELIDPIGFSVEIADSLASTDYALNRALSLSSTISEVGSFLDSLPFDITNEECEERTEYIREHPLCLNSEIDETDISSVKHGRPPALTERAGNIRKNHEKIVCASIINQEAWNVASWLGLGYMVSGAGEPALTFIFEDSAGEKIFEEWKAGGDAAINKIRIGIIKGINKANPLNYRVVVTSALPVEDVKQDVVFTSIARIKTIEPASLESLTSFEEALIGKSNLFILPSLVKREGLFPLWSSSISINRNAISIIDAYEITPEDYSLLFGIFATDDPIVPQDCINPYVLKLIEEKKQNMK